MVPNILKNKKKSPAAKIKVGLDITAPFIGREVGLSPGEIALDTATAGLGSLFMEDINRRKYVKEKGYGDAYDRARAKISGADMYPGMNVEKSSFKLTDEEDYAFNVLGKEFDEQLAKTREEEAAQYDKIQKQYEDVELGLSGPLQNVFPTNVLAEAAYKRYALPPVMQGLANIRERRANIREKQQPGNYNFLGAPLNKFIEPRTNFKIGGDPKDKKKTTPALDKPTIPIDPNAPTDPSRRDFMEKGAGLGALGVGLATGAVKFAPEIKKAVTSVTTQIDQMPEIIGELYFTIKNRGKITDYGRSENPITIELGPYKLEEGPGGFSITKTTDSDYRYQQEYFEVQTDPEKGAIGYEELTVRPDLDGKLKDVDYGVELDTYREIGEFLAKVRGDDSLIKIADEDILKQIEKEEAYKRSLQKKGTGEND